MVWSEKYPVRPYLMYPGNLEAPLMWGWKVWEGQAIWCNILKFTETFENVQNTVVSTIFTCPQRNLHLGGKSGHMTSTNYAHLPELFASSSMVWISEHSDTLCSSTCSKNLAWVRDTFFNKEYSATVCSHSFQVVNQLVIAFTWSLNWWVDFIVFIHCLSR